VLDQVASGNSTDLSMHMIGLWKGGSSQHTVL